MKTIINENGEVVDVETKNEIVLRKLYEAGTSLTEFEQMLDQLDYIKEQIETWEITHRDDFLAVMKECDVNKIQTQTRTYSRIPETTKKTLDIERLKEDGVYDRYLKLSRTKESLRITRRKND